MSQSVKQCISVDLFPHILPNAFDIQKVHLLSHTPLLNKTPRLSSARVFVRLYRLLLIHCIYVLVTKPTCPAFSAWLNTGAIRSMKVTGKAIMFCCYGININVMCSTTWPIQCWFNVWLQAMLKFGLVSFGGNSIRSWQWPWYRSQKDCGVNSRSQLCPIERRSCLPKKLSSGCLQFVNWAISSCLTSQASRLY